MESPVIFTLGKYEVTGMLGQGGIAVVYKGYHREIDRFLAIKVLRPHYRLDPQFVERFKLEARVVARLQHPHIVPLYDYGNDGDVWYLVTAYIQGGSLANLIAAGPLPVTRIEKLLREVVSALDYAHRRGVIHRDIKPSNILRDSEGHALLSDFGIVKIVGAGTNLTGTGNILGTPIYIAPEQARGRDVDERSDIYSLGVVVFEMLTGQPPYRAQNSQEAMLMHVRAPIPSVSSLRPNLPPALEATMQRVLAKNPDDRFQTAVEFYEDFSRAFHSDESVVKIKSGTAQVATVEHEQVRSTGKSHERAETIILNARPRRRLMPVALAAVAVVAALAVIFGRPASTVPTIETFGSLTFSTVSTPGDLIRLEVQALPALPAGQHYAAWLRNSADGTTTLLGSLAVDDSGAGSLTYIDPEGRVLLSQFDAMVITEALDDALSDAGSVRYSGRVPGALSTALTEILAQASNLPEEATTRTASYGPAAKPLNSLFDGAFMEATVGQMHSGLAARAPNVGALYIHAEHTINILLGTRDDYNGNGRGENPGRKIGVPFFLDGIDEQVNEAVNDPDTPDAVQSELRAILICTQNMRTWMNRVIELEHELLLAEDIVIVEPQKTESTRLTMAMLEGMDFNQNGEVEPIEGECGLQQVSDYALRAASMTIVEGPPGSS